MDKYVFKCPNIIERWVLPNHQICLDWPGVCSDVDKASTCCRGMTSPSIPGATTCLGEEVIKDTWPGSLLRESFSYPGPGRRKPLQGA